MLTSPRPTPTRSVRPINTLKDADPRDIITAIPRVPNRPDRDKWRNVCQHLLLQLETFCRHISYDGTCGAVIGRQNMKLHIPDRWSTLSGFSAESKVPARLVTVSKPRVDTRLSLPQPGSDYINGQSVSVDSREKVQEFAHDSPSV